MKTISNKILALAVMALPVIGMTSCSDSYMEELNTDKTKAETLNPNTQLTTGLLQTYGDFGLMDAYRCYVTGFTQHFAGGWNVSNYGGAVKSDNDMMRSIWDEYYNVAIKNMVDAISRSENMPNVNAILRIHKVYIMSVLTDTYGDIPCSEAGLGYLKHIANPKYDKQEDIYNWFFDELEACINQLGEGDRVTGDVTSYSGDVNLWKKYANSLRMRFAMRISDVNPQKAQEEFEKALNAPCGYIKTLDENAYVKYIDGPFTLYDGARELDFRVNALGEMLYGQDASSPTFVCATFYEMMKQNNDPRLYRICRFYNNVKRGEASADETGNLDFTDEVITYMNSAVGVLEEGYSYACVPGAAWYSNAKPKAADCSILSKWVELNAANLETYFPKLKRLIDEDPNGGYNTNNYHNRMLRPFLSIKLEKGNTPGILMTNAEVEFLLAEAKMLGWNVEGSVESHYNTGVRASMQMLNAYYDIDPISDEEINSYIAAHPVGTTEEAQKERINTEAWILHTMNPAEAWANMRRSDYPYIIDRSKYEVSDFTSDDNNLTTPVRLKYPSLEAKYNKANYEEALSRMGGKEDWHHRVWWDTKENTHLK
ncbi:MAG: SusD/RagB family nutrient-binding outer membrane lipoprotein [Bacteroidaceae bacterium]|nr:SusD/RagB family nutrient-binding outer membrane lipoprotein [Bacteroidaceae bacterium]